MRCGSRTPRTLRTAVAALGVAALLAGCSSTGGSSPSSTPGATSSTVSTVPSGTSPSAANTATGTPSLDAAGRAALAGYYAQKLAWTSCKGGFQCATLHVPLDYANPAAGAPLNLALIRLPAADPSRRIGSLVMNPGGPGGSGVTYVRYAQYVVTPGIRARYDLVGFDPRGVVGSTPNIRCVSDAQLDRYIAANATNANVAQQVRYARQFANGCARLSPTLLPFVGTRDAAHDMDVLRAALHENRLDYLGKSYGTLLGATYAEEFPTRVGRFVLDGVVDPSLSAEAMLKGQAAGFERAYRSFLAYCVRQGCPLGTSVDSSYDHTVTWLNRLEKKPLGPAGGRKLTQALAILAISGSLYEDRSQWPALRRAWTSALRGSPYAMLAIADSEVDRNANGHYTDNGNEAQYAVSCLDRAYPATVAQMEQRAWRFAAADPVFGEYIAWGDLPCTMWRAAPTRQAKPVTTPGIPPMLVLGTTRDPATPYPWAKSLVNQLGNARLLTWIGDGHTAYDRGSSCVDAIVDRYLLTGTLPSSNPTCSGR